MVRSRDWFGGNRQVFLIPSYYSFRGNWGYLRDYKVITESDCLFLLVTGMFQLNGLLNRKFQVFQLIGLGENYVFSVDKVARVLWESYAT